MTKWIKADNINIKLRSENYIFPVMQPLKAGKDAYSISSHYHVQKMITNNNIIILIYCPALVLIKVK